MTISYAVLGVSGFPLASNSRMLGIGICLQDYCITLLKSIITSYDPKKIYIKSYPYLSLLFPLLFFSLCSTLFFPAPKLKYFSIIAFTLFAVLIFCYFPHPSLLTFPFYFSDFLGILSLYTVAYTNLTLPTILRV